jgi:hypothetical protein
VSLFGYRGTIGPGAPSEDDGWTTTIALSHNRETTMSPVVVVILLLSCGSLGLSVASLFLGPKVAVAAVLCSLLAIAASALVRRVR